MLRRQRHSRLFLWLNLLLLLQLLLQQLLLLDLLD